MSGGASEPPLEDPPLADKPRVRRRWPWVLLALFALLGVAAWFSAEPLLRWFIVREARSNGVELSFETVSFSCTRLVLGGCVVRLVDVDGVEVTVDSLTIDLVDYKPTAVQADGVDVSLAGGFFAVLHALRSWADAHAGVLEVPADAQIGTLSWRAPGAGEWLRLERAKASWRTPRAQLAVERAQMFSRDVGALDVDYGDGKVAVAMPLGSPPGEDVPVQLTATFDKEPLEADVTLKRTIVAKLAGPFGVALPDDLALGGSAHLRFVEGPEAGPIVGTARAKLEGYSPPVPREVKGLAFGKTTEIETSFKVSDDRNTVTLEETRVKHGAVSLKGDGRVERRDGRAQLHAVLAGNLACRELAAAAAAVRVPGEAGKLLAELARATVTGGVGLRVVVDADFARMSDARIVPTIGLGCGLRGLPKFQLPELPELPDVKLPDVKLPELPKLPDFPP